VSGWCDFRLAGKDPKKHGMGQEVDLRLWEEKKVKPTPVGQKVHEAREVKQGLLRGKRRACRLGRPITVNGAARNSNWGGAFPVRDNRDNGVGVKRVSMENAH